MPVTLNASTSSGLVQTADTSGTVEIQSNGTTRFTVASTGAYGQLVSGTAQTASSTAVDFTGIPSWVKRITVMFSGVSLNGTSDILVQLGTSGGIVSSGYVSASLVQSTSPATAISTSTAGFVVRMASAASVCYGQMFISLVNTNEYVSSHAGRQTATTIMTGGGNSSLGGTLTQIRITTVNGTDTFDAGTINILFEG